MGRPKKDSKNLNIKMDVQLYETLEKYAEVQGQTKTTAVERILREHFIKEGFIEK